MKKIDYLIQENGKALAHFEVNYIISDEELTEVASQYIEDTSKIKKVVIVPNRLVNVIT